MYKVKGKQHIWFNGKEYHGGDTLPDDFETQFVNFDSVVIKIENEAIDGEFVEVDADEESSAKSTKGRK